MIIRVLAPALSHLRPALRLAGPARPVGSLQGRRAAGAAARGRRAAPHPSAAPARLGRPRCARRADLPPASKAADAPAGQPRHRPALAPPPGHPQVDLPAPHRTAAGQRRDRRAHRAARHREPRLGIPADPRRTAQVRPPGRRVYDPQGPQGVEDSPGTGAALRQDVAEVPAYPVGFHNSATGRDLGFYAARSYSLMRPPRTARRLIRSWEGPVMAWSELAAAMGSSSVVVGLVLGQDRPRVAVTEDLHPIGDLCSD